MALWGRKKGDDKVEAVAEPAKAVVPGNAAGASNERLRPQIPEVEKIGANSKLEIKTQPTPVAAPDQKPAIPVDIAEKRAGDSKRLMMAFGEVVSVLMRSPQFKEMPLRQIEALVVPAVMTGQFVVAEATFKESGFVTPVATVLWATVSEEIDKRLSSIPEQPLQLTANEWRSGDIPWLIALAGDPRVINPLLKALQDNRLKGRSLKTRFKSQNGKMEVGNIDPAVRARDAATKA